jgi:Na+-translocating ferredoxin:NAD+ oxidoreductase subunit B
MQATGSETLYRRLQQHLDRMPVGFPATDSGVEIRILQQLFTPEEAEIALELSLIPEPAGVIHKRLRSRLTLDELVRALERMDGKGLILRLGRGEEARYSKLIFAVGFYERQVKRLTPQLERDSLQYMQEAFGEAFHSRKTTQMRIVPVNRSIAAERSVATYDDIRRYVTSSAGPFAKMTCICRHGRDLLGEPCQQTALRENCLTLGMAARWAADSGIGQTISREEMLALLDAADTEGLVLQSENTKNPLFVCCCCHCCCSVLTMAKRLPRPAEHFSSNFYVRVDPDACQSCGACETRCQMDAIRAGDGQAEVDLARCIGCAICVTTCPSDALRLEAKAVPRVPPDGTQQLYVKILQERYGPVGMLGVAAKRALGMKI